MKTNGYVLEWPGDLPTGAGRNRDQRPGSAGRRAGKAARQARPSRYFCFKKCCFLSLHLTKLRWNLFWITVQKSWKFAISGMMYRQCRALTGSRRVRHHPRGNKPDRRPGPRRGLPMLILTQFDAIYLTVYDCLNTVWQTFRDSFLAVTCVLLHSFAPLELHLSDVKFQQMFVTSADDFSTMTSKH